MATCPHCTREMLDTPSCTVTHYADFLDRKTRLRLRYGQEGEDWGADSGRCHDCAAEPGGFHHPGCDVERCARCGGQDISCGCHTDAGPMLAKAATLAQLGLPPLETATGRRAS